MKRFYLFVLVLLMGSSFTMAQKTLDQKTLEEVESAFSLDNYTRSSMNALTRNGVKEVAKNHQLAGTVDHYFSHRVNVSGITDQKSSGRCWMFTSLNLLRPKAMERLNVSSFEFSESYLFFWDMFEKANLFLENALASADKPMDDRRVHHYFHSPVADGGAWNSFANLITKYGVVPKEVMPETYTSSNTRWMVRLLNRKLRQQGMELRKLVAEKAGKKDLADAKMSMLKDVYRILALNIGVPPKEFQWRYENKDGNVTALASYTPQSFAQAALPSVDFSDYVMFMNDPTRPYYQVYEIENYRNVVEGQNWLYINLPNEDLKEMAIASIKDNEAMYASCDVGKQLDSKFGLLAMDNYDFEAIYGLSFAMDKQERILTGDSGSAHGMALIAVDLDENGKSVKWQFENSWGASSGHNGYLTFTDEWFDNYLFRLVVREKYIPKRILKLLDEKPVVLPPWDPMG